jgi:hypothetical protein
MKRKSISVAAKQSSVTEAVSKDIVFKEAVGKTVELIRFVSEPIDAQAFELRFTDGTSLYLEPRPRFFFRARYLTLQDGDVQSLLDFGILPH